MARNKAYYSSQKTQLQAGNKKSLILSNLSFIINLWACKTNYVF